ncbi:hypothetical protein EV382_1390 [Micromonospora violae]|uniref:G domain-containing protein n=2 Tax=Micromonospora violae TaxID=1278207 RepID=A0A4Q7UD84_9ACTN|nr:hypothetical protein [Micromonospora violae]RZT78208.1 hypothetical protein EV382_1390 [Micromonospora violae]
MMIVGDRFAGKSALFHRISNSSGYVQQRTKDHTTHKVVIRGRKGKVNALVAVTPGQQVGEEFVDGDIDAWNAMLQPPNYPSGVIYVVAERMTRSWTADEINIVEQQRAAMEAGQRESLQRALEEAWRDSLDHEPSPEELRAKLPDIDQEVDRRTPSQSEQYWQLSMDNECKHFELIARRLLESWGNGSAAQNAWLIIAVTKVDLHRRNQLDELKRYYIPNPSVPLSPFGRLLSDFIRGFGSGPKPRLAILPFAGQRENFRVLPSVAEATSQLDDTRFDALQRTFNNTLGEFCGLQS